MDYHPHTTDNALGQTDQELSLIFTTSDGELEKAAGGATSAQTYPSTGVATICVPDLPFPKKLSGQAAQPR
jgi:hypothetical protein